MKPGTGAALLELQRLDLQLARDKRELASLPEVRELAKKRKALQKLQTEATKLYARHKDLDTDLSDLDAEERACSEKVGEVQGLLAQSTDYRIVQNYNQELSDLAKRLDKIDFKRSETKRAREELSSKEEQLAAYTERFEASMRDDAQRARSKAAGLQARIAQAEEERAEVAAGLEPDVLAAYGEASTRFDGLAVERLQGSVPSICRTTLAPAALGDLRHVDEVGSCPYCHRMLVVDASDKGARP